MTLKEAEQLTIKKIADILETTDSDSLKLYEIQNALDVLTLNGTQMEHKRYCVE